MTEQQPEIPPPHPLTDAHRIALGSITFEYALTDQAVSTFLSRMICWDDRIAKCVIAGMPITAKVDLLARLYRLMESTGEPVDVNSLSDRLKLVTNATQRRNDVVHATHWIPGAPPAGDMQFWNLTKKTAPQMKVQSASVEELTKVAQELRAATDALQQFMFQHFEKCGSGPWNFLNHFGVGTPWGATLMVQMAFGAEELKKKGSKEL